MPTRTAFIITIGEVLESGPPRNNRSSSNSKNQTAARSSGVDDSGDDSSASTSNQPPRAASPASSCYSDAPRPRRFRKRNRIMKTRVSNTGGSSAATLVSATSNGPTTTTANGTASRRPRLQSVDQVYLGNSNNNPLSPRTRSTTKQEVDEEVSFVDPLSTVDVKIECNGIDQNGVHNDDSEDNPIEGSDQLTHHNGPPKKKRKSSAEKFLEDNSEYYGFQDDVNKRTTTHPTRHRSGSQSDHDVIKSERSRSRHSSGASVGLSKRRIRANSSSSNHHNEVGGYSSSKKLVVEVTKLENLKASDLSTKETSDLSSSDERNEEDQLRPQRKKLRSRSNFDNVSPASKKRRSELDKLLDAGLSSFHCETAKQAAERLGPLQVDVSDNNSGSEASCYDDKLPKSKNSRLLQEADVNQNSKGKKGRKPKKSRNKNNKTDQSDVSPSTSCERRSPTIPDLDELKKEVDGSEVNPFSELEFSFERTPHREGWFQTYSRQDLGDELLYYSDHQYFPLPYEMPMNTFYPWRENKPGGKKSLKNTPEASGSATPINIDQDEDSMPTPMRTTRNKSMKKNLNEASFFDKIDPKKAKALQAADIFARKSPRGHASTKSYLVNTNGSINVDDDEAFEHILYHGIAVDECSNDSVMSSFSNKKAGGGSGPKCESIGQLIEIANRLDAFFCEEDPLLISSTSEQNQNNQKKRSRRRSSSGQTSSQQQNSGRSKRRSKDQINDNNASSSSNTNNTNSNVSNGVDRIVDTNVDPVFLDCLEDELPSVTFDDPNRSINDPMEWIGTYDQCTSINLFSNSKGKNKKFSSRGGSMMSPQAASISEKQRDSSLDTNDDDNIPVNVDPKCQPTILRRLLTSPDSDTNNKKDEEENVIISNNIKNISNENRPLIKPKLITDDSSSECASVSESVASSSSTRRRRRNMTGFPSPKKKKNKNNSNSNIIAPSLNPKGRKAKENNMISPKANSKNSTNNKSKQTAASSNNSKSSAKSSSVQMQLKLTKNGTLSLQKPINNKHSQIKDDTASNKQQHKGRPLSKSKSLKQQQQPPSSRSRSTAASKNSNNKPKPKGPPKYPKIDKNKHEIIEIPSSSNEEDESDFDDVDDKSFHPNGSSKPKTKGGGRRRKKKKRKLTMPVKRKFVLVKPKVIDIADEDDDNDSEIPSTNHNNKNDNEFSTEESSDDSENNQNDERSADDSDDGIPISRKKGLRNDHLKPETEGSEEDDEEASDEGSDDDDDDEDEEDIPISRKQAAKKNKGNKPLRPRVIRKRKQS